MAKPPYNWGNAVTKGSKPDTPPTHTPEARWPIRDNSCATQGFCFVGIWSKGSRNSRSWYSQHTLSSRTRIFYPKKLFLHCRALPKHHKAEQGAKITLPWNINCLSITFSSHRLSASTPCPPVPRVEGTGASWACSFLSLERDTSIFQERKTAPLGQTRALERQDGRGGEGEVETAE